MKDIYTQFLNEASSFIPQDRIYTDELRRLAWGTDAGFYRLIPQIVIRSDNEEEVSQLLRLADRLGLPVTFRAAGTSLSGQSISDSILIVAGKHWEKYSITPDGEQITLQPGIIGQRVNELLAPYGRKFAPDPASVKSAMVGGIVMNNASGMNCGTHANSDKMMLSARLVMADGTVLDTGDPVSRAAFEVTHRDFIRGICHLRDRIHANPKLLERIRYKYAIKNVTGLNLLPFIRFDDPFDIIAHLMVGSEGTLAFLSQVTMRTEYDYPCKASAMVYFTDIREACRAVVAMKKLSNAHDEWIVKGAELLDYKSLSSVDDPVYVKYKGEVADPSGLTAILTETKARTPEELYQDIAAIEQALAAFQTYIPVHFTDKPEEYGKFWAIRSGIFPSVGGTRRPGTTCLIEDVAFHIEDLPEATAALQQLIARHGYDDACIYGHALEGNYHFILNQSFATQAEVDRYEALMEDVKTLVVDKYDGSLKAEHGTGRNMAPYVRYEWGDEAYEVMKAVKQLFDPKGLLNPGVIFNDDPKCHLKNFKPLPLLNEEVRMKNEELGMKDKGNEDKRTSGDSSFFILHSTLNKINRCIECGFCEVNCLSCGFTLSSRQRIVIQRELARLRQEGDNPERLALLEKQYRYLGNQTCAGDGLCSLSCPMGINTGDLTHLIRQRLLPPGSSGYKAGDYAARHFAGIKGSLRPVLTLADTAHAILGTAAMSRLTRGMHNLLGIPQWTPAMPKAYKIKDEEQRMKHEENTAKVVYFPSCINQTMGLARKSPVEQALVNKMIALLHKAGYEVIFPKNMEKLCCGTIWESKGMMDIADRKTRELEDALWEASQQGRYPVLCDQSPCLHRMRETIHRMKLYEPAEFIYTFLRDRLTFTPIDRPVALHITCSMRKMGLANTLIALARLCSTQVFVPEEVGCCGFAGDRGFTHPELNAYALRKLRPQIEERNIQIGYSNSRTCEIGLTTNSGIPYVSIAYLVDECTTPKKQN
ncbi:FAD-binding and (Fe-S)-binding domain-containing protein [Mediterranea massiliensis]|uniref:FAD-binding and (Fe-S)-binding domain-containing protein n=1 Tax=Mediterranea massiliensis TaxID=1841865 RepID=UPI0025A38246|nr:FAD-binding and (Fe-S)-binding domain-containing protein [Mediterranea massiliensis]MDM8335899.1 FAD-binding and (Fe-S)-binding domain-containing protein [Mediterranea massiliensis]